ncbi:MAG: hypothetical protein LBQ35_07440, partial [Spirochaetaceae bacterium]|nr:hypothetical protein [Spirochaetaceae bacterium]
MADTLRNLEILSTRPGFNSAVRYIKKTLAVADDLGEGLNLGDILFEIQDPELSGDRIGLLLRMLLVDKMGYHTVSANLVNPAEDPPALAGEFAKWNAVDLLAAYHHPDLGLIAANPKVAAEIANLGNLRKHELLVIYAGKGGGGKADAQCREAALLAAALFEGEKPKIPAALYKGPFSTEAAAAESPGGPVSPAGPAPAAAAGITRGPKRMTPMYSVVVQNELFHNGNVEAWKRIIDSYNAKYPELQVYIYYEGERIIDINSLFKWGKVKHGSSIQFAVAGSEIRDVAK